MFADNKVISSRQIYRLFVFCYVGIGSLVLPGRIAARAGAWGLVCIAAGEIISLLYLHLINKIAEKMGENVQNGIEGPAPVRVGVRLLLCIHCVLTAGYCLDVFASVMRENLVQGEGRLLIMGLILALAVYGISGGLESWARIYEILFCFVFLPLFLMLALGMGNMEKVYLLPDRLFDLSGLARGGWEVFCTFLLSFWVLFLPGKGSDRRGMKKAVNLAQLTAFVFFALIYEVVLGNFGPKALEKLPYPAITLMSMIRIPGSFVKRLDALMLGVWFFSLFAMLTLQLFFGVKLFGQLWGKGEESRHKKRALLVISALTAGVGGLSEFFPQGRALYEAYMETLGPALLLIIPVILALCSLPKGKRRRSAALLTVLLASAELSACSARELEDRCFPMMALVDVDQGSDQVSFCYTFPKPRRAEDQGDDTREVDTSFSKGKGFVRAWRDYEDRLDKKADDSHLKVVVLGQRFLRRGRVWDEMLDFMQEKQSFPRNAYVCVMEEPGQLLEIQGKLSDDAGNYLEAYLKNNPGEKAHGCVTLGMLMDERENRMRRLYLPYIRVRDDSIIWKDYYIVDRGRAVGYRKIKKSE